MVSTYVFPGNFNQAITVKVSLFHRNLSILNYKMFSDLCLPSLGAEIVMQFLPFLKDFSQHRNRAWHILSAQKQDIEMEQSFSTISFPQHLGMRPKLQFTGLRFSSACIRVLCRPSTALASFFRISSLELTYI